MSATAPVHVLRESHESQRILACRAQPYLSHDRRMDDNDTAYAAARISAALAMSLALSAGPRAGPLTRCAHPPRPGSPGAGFRIDNADHRATRTPGCTDLHGEPSASYNRHPLPRASRCLPRMPSSPLSLAILVSARSCATGLRGINSAAQGTGAGNATRSLSLRIYSTSHCTRPFPSPGRLVRATCPDARR